MNASNRRLIKALKAARRASALFAQAFAALAELIAIEQTIEGEHNITKRVLEQLATYLVLEDRRDLRALLRTMDFEQAVLDVQRRHPRR